MVTLRAYAVDEPPSPRQKLGKPLYSSVFNQSRFLTTGSILEHYSTYFLEIYSFTKLIHCLLETLQCILDTRKTELISQLQHITQRKLKRLTVQRDQLETTLAQLYSVVLNACIIQ